MEVNMPHDVDDKQIQDNPFMQLLDCPGDFP